MASWPTTLPRPVSGGYMIKPIDQTIRTDMDVGAARVRRRTAARNDLVSVGWIFSDAQLTIFRAWFDDAAAGAAGGSAWFTMSLMQGTGGSVTATTRFKGPFTVTSVGASVWSVSAELEIR